jgi:type I restriction enzyme R subunit
MTKITESAIEKFTVELLEKQGYHYIYAPNIAPDSETPERQSDMQKLATETVLKQAELIADEITHGKSHDY